MSLVLSNYDGTSNISVYLMLTLRSLPGCIDANHLETVPTVQVSHPFLIRENVYHDPVNSKVYVFLFEPRDGVRYMFLLSFT